MTEFIIFVAVLMFLLNLLIIVKRPNQNIEQSDDTSKIDISKQSESTKSKPRTTENKPQETKEKKKEFRGMKFDYYGIKDESFFEEIPMSDTGIGHYLVIDTETNGLPVYYNDEPENIDNWPRILSLGIILLDEHLKVVEEAYHLVKPDFELNPAAIAINGLTKEILEKDGIETSHILEIIQIMSKKSKVLVAHNIGFDLPVIQAEFIRAGRKKPFTRHKKICTKIKGTKYCEIPSPYRETGYKWPNLTELVCHCYFVPFQKLKISGNHHALNDAWLTAKCLKVLYYWNYV